ncbi:uncharacterized protein cubi_03276 [Cryptosporidium ubiquitum]|uniref:Uncharacterized protein n=1 Tax=Cryptosporidium ubiquitum TaxID=857276 RepID=A0A1J4M9T8_9CRYT|nr:uncharacterized protein cubi_03276 [Cryptosporidium ubiquitum]OII70978.1 hypothetical protein cubi_03276 [Cryptosporidium ubiquitum]
MSKTKRLLFGAYSLISLSVIVLFSGGRSGPFSRNSTYLFEKIFQTELSERTFGLTLSLKEKQTRFTFESISLKKAEKQQSKEIKQADKNDESEIKKIGKNSGVESKEITKKIKELKKQLKKERKTNPNARLMEIFNESGGFSGSITDSGDSDSIPNSTSSFDREDGLRSGTGSNRVNSANSTSNRVNSANSTSNRVNSANSTASLTKEEKKQQKKQDKEDEKEVNNRLISSGMTKSEAKKKLKELKKQLKTKRKSGFPRATLLDIYEGSSNGTVMEGGTTRAPSSDIETRVSNLEKKVNKLIRKNKKRKASIDKLNSNMSKLAFIVRRMTKNRGINSNSPFGDDDNDDDDDA